MAFSNLNTDFHKRLEQHRKSGDRSNLSIYQVARIMDGIKVQERNDYAEDDVLVNYRVCLN